MTARRALLRGLLLIRLVSRLRLRLFDRLLGLLLRHRLTLRRLLRFGLRFGLCGLPGGLSLFGLLLHFLRQLLPGLEHLACQLLEAVAGAGADAGLLAHAPAKVVELR